MNTNSEKEMYDAHLHEEVPNFNAEYFVWGAELFDKKLILYLGKLKQIPGYEDIKEALEPCGVVLVNVNKTNYLRCTSATIDTERGNVYMTEANFNAAWGDLKRSVKLGIRIAQQEGRPCPVKQPEEIVALDHLVRQGSDPVIENNVIRYHQREQTEEEKQIYGRRQSLLDNPRMLYFFLRNRHVLPR